MSQQDDLTLPATALRRNEQNVVWLDAAQRPDALTVRQLIDLLSKLDPETPMMIGGTYGGFVDVRGLEQRAIRLRVNRLDGFGPHDVAVEGEHADCQAAIIVGAGNP